jgi:hypothetical protein
MMTVLWNPTGVLDIHGSGTWGAPQGGDPRLCCITRSGLNRRISRAEFATSEPQWAYFLTRNVGEDEFAEEDFTACRLCAREPKFSADILASVAHQVRLAAIRKSSPAERTYLNNQSRQHPVEQFSSNGRKIASELHES